MTWSKIGGVGLWNLLCRTCNLFIHFIREDTKEEATVLLAPKEALVMPKLNTLGLTALRLTTE